MNWLRKTARRTNRRCQRQKNAGAWFRFQDARYSNIQSLIKNPDGSASIIVVHSWPGKPPYTRDMRTSGNWPGKGTERE